jgi:hypothetical protein
VVRAGLKSSPLSLQPSPLLVDFVSRQVRHAQLHLGAERRMESRASIVMPVMVQPIDAHFQAIGGPLAMVVREISSRGFSLVGEERLDCDWIALRLKPPEEEAVLVGEILWKKPVGPFYACGCEVIAKLDEFPT